MKPKQKVTNIVSLLPTYCDKGTNILGYVTTISWNTRFALFFKFMFLYELWKFYNPKTGAFDWKRSEHKKLPTHCDKGTNILGQVANISWNTGFDLFFKFMFLYELLKFLNLQT